MIVKDLDIKEFDWHVRIFYAVDCYYTPQIMEELSNIHCPRNILKKAFRNMNACRLNTGLTYSNNALRETIMIIGMWTSPDEFINSFSHELRHFTDHIANAFGLESGGEEVAYLTGDIHKELYPVNKMFLCECNCHNRDIDKEICNCTTHR